MGAVVSKRRREARRAERRKQKRLNTTAASPSSEPQAADVPSYLTTGISIKGIEFLLQEMKAMIKENKGAGNEKPWTTADVCQHIVYPATKVDDCSFAELILSTAQEQEQQINSSSNNSRNNSNEDSKKSSATPTQGDRDRQQQQQQQQQQEEEEEGLRGEADEQLPPSHTTPATRCAVSETDRAVAAELRRKLAVFLATQADTPTAKDSVADNSAAATTTTTTTAAAAVIGRATVFISHAWRFEFEEVAGVMQDMALEDPSTFFWFDLVCNNQVSSAALPHDFWSNTFAASIQQIGRVAVVFSPWHDPIPVRRSWCLWEINCGIQTPAFEVRVPRNQAALMRAGILDDFSALPNALAAIDAKKAEATKPSDAELIAETIRRGTGFAAFNYAVKEKLREWYLGTAEQALASHPNKDSFAYAHLCTQVAVTQGQFGRTDAAIDNVRAALAVYEAHLQPHDLQVVRTLNNLAGLFLAKDDGEAAMRTLKDAQARMQQLVQHTPPALDKTVKQAGTAAGSGGNNDTGKAEGGEDEAVGEQRPSERDVKALKAAIANNLGKAWDHAGIHSLAAQKHKKACALLTELHGKESIPVATSLNNIGTSLHGDGEELEAAAETHRRALALRSKLCGTRHDDTANSHERLGDVLLDLRQWEDARGHYEEALSIKRENLGSSSRDVKRLERSLARLDAKLRSAGAHGDGDDDDFDGRIAAMHAIPEQMLFVSPAAPPGALHTAREARATNPLFVPSSPAKEQFGEKKEQGEEKKEEKKKEKKKEKREGEPQLLSASAARLAIPQQVMFVNPTPTP